MKLITITFALMVLISCNKEKFTESNVYGTDYYTGEKVDSFRCTIFENGNPIKSKIAIDGFCQIVFTGKYTNDYSIEITNPSNGKYYVRPYYDRGVDLVYEEFHIQLIKYGTLDLGLESVFPTDSEDYLEFRINDPSMIGASNTEVGWGSEENRFYGPLDILHYDYFKIPEGKYEVTTRVVRDGVIDLNYQNITITPFDTTQFTLQY